MYSRSFLHAYKTFFMAFLLLSLNCQSSTNEQDEKQKTKLNSNFSILPPMSIETLGQQWNIQGAFQVEEGKILMHNGQPTQKSVIFNYNPLHYDDYIELEIKVKFEKKISQTANVNREDQINAFFIQFLAQYPEDAFKSVNDKEIISLEGFSIILLTHDSHQDHAQNVQTYFATYRHFPSTSNLNRDYL